MIKMLGRNYVPLALHNLGGVQLGLFCKASIVKEVDYAAHVKNVEARNADYWRIVSELEAHMLDVEKELDGRSKLRQSPSSQFLSPHSSSSSSSVTSEDSSSEKKNTIGGENLMKSMDHIFFCGDLNYRIDLPREVIEQKILEMRSIVESSSQDGEMATTSSSLDEDGKKRLLGTLRLDLLRHDQLLQMISEGRAFPDLTEGEIRFPPTFKFDKGSPDMYDTSYKQRVPAWTDRILHRPFGVKVLDYNSVPSATSSDHRPVYGTYSVSMLGRKRSHEKDSGDYEGFNNKRRRRTKSFSKNRRERESIRIPVCTTVGNRRKRRKRRNK